MASLQETDINDDGFFTVPIGTTAQRPSTPLPGMLRWNTSLGYLEHYNSDEADWFEIGSGGALYEFTEATFTPGNTFGATGPSLAEARNGLSGPEASQWKNNTEFFNTSAGIQQWTVPVNGIYRIEALGARGGNNSSGHLGGLGARMSADFTLVEGQILQILVGQRGNDAGYACSGNSGGGGTFVVEQVSGTLTNSNILIVAGGGGGGGLGAITQNRKNGTTGNNGLTGDGSAESGAGGTSGNGGGAGTGCVVSSGGGAGVFGNGLTGNGGGAGGQSFVNGGAGGVNGSNSSGTSTGGGFGGAGGGERGGGGGGGYSGGGGGGLVTCACANLASGGGGGSFNNGANQSNSSGINATDGQVTITLL